MLVACQGPPSWAGVAISLVNEVDANHALRMLPPPMDLCRQIAAGFEALSSFCLSKSPVTMTQLKDSLVADSVIGWADENLFEAAPEVRVWPRRDCFLAVQMWLRAHIASAPVTCHMHCS